MQRPIYGSRRIRPNRYLGQPDNGDAPVPQVCVLAVVEPLLFRGGMPIGAIDLDNEVRIGR